MIYVSWRRSNKFLPIFFGSLLLTLCHSAFGMHFVLISAPGSGKGTFSQYMIKNHDYVQICPGDLFRKEIALGTDLGKTIQPIVDRGDYVDEVIVCQIIEKSVCEALEQKKYFILDGFPRSERSFNFLCDLLKNKKLQDKTCFLQFVVSDDLCANRIISRAVCMECFRVYNTVSNQPGRENRCDDCGAELSLRKADIHDVAHKRLAYFHDNIEFLMQKAAQRNYHVKKINGDASLDTLEKEYEKLIADDVNDTDAHNRVNHKNHQLDLYLDLIRYNTQEKIGILPYILKKREGTFLEIGTGGDPIAEMLTQIPSSAQVTLIASDIDEGILRSLPQRHPVLQKYLNAQEGLKLKLMKLDATDMSVFQDNSLDGINASSVVHEIISYAGGVPALNTFFQEASRTLKPGGVLIYRDPENVSDYNSKVSVALKTKNIRLFAHIFLYKFMDKRGSSLEKAGNKFCLYNPKDIEFTVFKKNASSVSQLTYEEYLSIPSYDIDFSRKYIITMPCGLYRELARHYLTYLHQCNPLMYVKCTSDICSEMYSLNYFAHSTHALLNSYFSQHQQIFDDGKINFDQKNMLEKHIDNNMQVLEFGIPLHFSSQREQCKLRELLQNHGFVPHSYMIPINNGDCLLDYRIFGLLYDEIRSVVFKEYNGVINSRDEEHAKWLKREGEESYFYMPADEMIVTILKTTQSEYIDEKGNRKTFVLSPLSADASKFIERVCYSEFLRTALEVQDDFGYEIEVMDGKRVIHFSKMLLQDAVQICKDIVSKNPIKYKALNSFIQSLTDSN